MDKILSLITEEVSKAFAQKGYSENFGKSSSSNRPDLCEYQCNGAMAAAKVYHKAPFLIADEIKEALNDNKLFESVESVKPGFLNIILNKQFLADYLNGMDSDQRYGCDKAKKKKTIVIDYGGPNVAKPLHVGHLRTAIIGESIKRIQKFMGHEVFGDVHMGDWGLPMGLIMTELKVRKPQLSYFDSGYCGEYPKEAPFTLTELEEIYPYASSYAKEHPEYKEDAMQATVYIQQGIPGYKALLEQILKISVEDLKKNYGNLNVSFELWKGESDAQPFIPAMVEKMKKDGFAHVSEGALVVDVKEDTDTKEIPPCIIEKSDGASLYATTDLATLVQRMQDYHPDEILYVVDKRQDMHFVQVFRCARKIGIIPDTVKLEFLGFGTMNGKDGKPFKTREGGVMRLETLLSDINEQMYEKIAENHTVEEEEGRKTAKMVALSAIKYGDLSNQASKDYVFDLERFTSFEGNTGPYLLYTIVRMKSILTKYSKAGKNAEQYRILPAHSESEKELMTVISGFNAMMENASLENAPHKVCSYLYELANAFNHFYHETKIMIEENQEIQGGYIKLLILTKNIMETCIDVLGFEAPDRM
ncbi:MAG: arginine--tRNA ligase [Lachnospiraceae bacterium]